jgi:hypothetical protein
MQHHRLLIPLTALSLALGACGGGTATEPPGGATTQPGGGTEATPAPQTTTDPGGGGPGGNPGGGSGQIHIEIGGGGLDVTVDEPFFTIGSRFGGDAGTALNFTHEGASGIASIGEVNGVVVISYVSEEMAANAQDCQLSNWNIGATSGSGSFDCKEGFATKTADGSFVSGVTMKGSFEANQ